MKTVAGVVAAAAWGMVGCGGGQDLPALVAVCRASDAACQRAAAAAHDRACLVMPAGLSIYMGPISDAALGQELQRLGVWEVESWIEGEDCS